MLGQISRHLFGIAFEIQRHSVLSHKLPGRREWTVGVVRERPRPPSICTRATALEEYRRRYVESLA